jgi:hypothetical protein
LNKKIKEKGVLLPFMEIVRNSIIEEVSENLWIKIYNFNFLN